MKENLTVDSRKKNLKEESEDKRRPVTNDNVVLKKICFHSACVLYTCYHLSIDTIFRRN